MLSPHDMLPGKRSAVGIHVNPCIAIKPQQGILYTEYTEEVYYNTTNRKKLKTERINNAH